MNLGKLKLSTSYVNNSHNSYLVAEANADIKLIDFQIEMLERNKPNCILPLEVRSYDNLRSIYFNITSRVTLAQYLKRNKLNKEQFTDILFGITNTITSSRQLLLNCEGFIIDENYIFINPGSAEIGLIYMPASIEVDIDELLKSFVIKLIVDLVQFEENSSDSYLQKILNCTRLEAFKCNELNKLLLQLRCGMLPECHTEPAENDRSYSREQAEHTLELKIKQAEEPVKSKPDKRVTIAVLIQVLLISLGVLVIQMLLGMADSTDSFSAITGTAIILSAIDLLVLRKLFLLKPREETPRLERKTGTFPKPSDVLGGIREKEYPKEQFKPVSNVKSSPKELVPEFATVVLERGATENAYLKNLSGGKEEIIVLCKDSFILGRLKDQADHVISSAAVGRLHAEITKRSGKYYLKDLNSRNGTKINNDRIVSNTDYEIKNNDIISLANCEFMFVNSFLENEAAASV